ncbi:dihydrodipicolinate synthase family protein [Lacimicrobium alkaliphilum]|uniref:Dihydrodipicolinate synthase family protein n=1 Tax=Lacimicrobium alkaliphilum TaxID=1526571 RepID=A0ABQ1R745_9ALTE|nr:dihydrodipicolinate synthase family protein [Lacimicrobium alkaliphilum]GGD60806.1 dihydrodipicolinate synthase family protein [Lacimicrobium alkaliphilum]
MFTGLCAFPLTPFDQERVDFTAFERLIANLVAAKVDSICAMGSTGLYPYLTQEERKDVLQHTVAVAQGTPVMVGIGALRTQDVLKHAETAQQAGADAVLLAPVSYHPLTQAEVYSLYESVTAELSVPLCVYENPRVTQFTFDDELYHEISRLPNVAAIKIPGTPFGSAQGDAYLRQLRSLVPETVAIGVSGDKFGAAGMAAGCDLWLSVLGGLFPKTVQTMLGTINAGTPELSVQHNASLEPLWEMFSNYGGGIRVMATAAGILGYTESDCLPKPLQPLQKKAREELKSLLETLPLY